MGVSAGAAQQEHLSIRIVAEDVLERHPSLSRRVPGAVAKAYRRARIDAAGETGLDESIFPAECPYTFDDVMTRPVPWPLPGGEA